ncbi:coiled-coil domain-containing protein 63-like [Amazona ochrocephala]
MPIEELEKKVAKQNLIATKVKQANSSKQLQKRIDKLEMRLYNASVHFNTIVAKNNKLREEIESLQIRKAVLDNFYCKLHTKLEQQKRRMNTAVEQTTQAYEQWSEAQARIADMSKRHRKDTAQYHIEMQEQERILARETKLKAFVLARFTDRSELEEQAKKERDLKAARRAKKRQGECSETREVVYKRLLELAEDGNVEQLLNSFIKKEHKSFACLFYASELNEDTPKMQRKIRELQIEVASLSKAQEHAEAQNSHLVKELEKNLTKTTEEANRYEDLCKERSKILGQLKSSMEVVLKGINCDTTDIMKQLGEKGEITDLNLMQYVGLTEKKTYELLRLESILRYSQTEGASPDLPFSNPLLGAATSSMPIEELEKKVAKQNLIATKVKQANSSKQLQKRIDKLEMRLYNASVHFNTIVAKNNKLREEIESLQIRKAVLDNFYCKLHTKLEQQKRRMNTAVEQTTQAYEQWSEAQARIADMSKRRRKDHIEMQEQERILARETKLKAFVLARFTDRSELEEQAKKERGCFTQLSPYK